MESGTQMSLRRSAARNACSDERSVRQNPRLAGTSGNSGAATSIQDDHAAFADSDVATLPDSDDATLADSDEATFVGSDDATLTDSDDATLTDSDDAILTDSDDANVADSDSATFALVCGVVTFVGGVNSVEVVFVVSGEPTANDAFILVADSIISAVTFCPSVGIKPLGVLIGAVPSTISCDMSTQHSSR